MYNATTTVVRWQGIGDRTKDLTLKANAGPRTLVLSLRTGQPRRYDTIEEFNVDSKAKLNKKAVLPQGNRAMPQVFFSVEVRQQHSLQV